MPPPAATAAANAVPVTDASAAQPKSGRVKNLVVIGAVVLALLAAAGGAAIVLLKKRAAAQAEEDGDTPAVDKADAEPEKFDPKAVPTFVALDMFTVNLADREAERYAQVGVTLEVPDTKSADLIKNYMPAIRNNILMVLADKTSQQLLEREGKHRLSAEILREALRPLGYETAADGKRKPDEDPPVRRVHFSNFIIQ